MEKQIKSEYCIGDIVSLTQTVRKGLMGDMGEFPIGTEIEVTAKHEMGFDGMTKEGDMILWLKDYYVKYVGKSFTK